MLDVDRQAKWCDFDAAIDFVGIAQPGIVLKGSPADRDGSIASDGQVSHPSLDGDALHTKGVEHLVRSGSHDLADDADAFLKDQSIGSQMSFERAEDRIIFDVDRHVLPDDGHSLGARVGCWHGRISEGWMVDCLSSMRHDIGARRLMLAASQTWPKGGQQAVIAMANAIDGVGSESGAACLSIII